jgi:hypothetical protein
MALTASHHLCTLYTQFFATDNRQGADLMHNEPVPSSAPPHLWRRALWMLIMALAWQVASTVMFVMAILQWLLFLLNREPNPRLKALGRSLGLYQSSISRYLSFNTEEIPFPFSDWPTA